MRIEKEELHNFAAELSRELGAPIDAQYSEHHWAFALNIEPGIRLFASVDRDKVNYSLIAHSGRGSSNVPGACGVSMSRGVEIAAKEIRNRLLPDALPHAHEILVKFAEEDAADYKNTSRGFRFVAFDLFGTVLNDRDETLRSKSDKAQDDADAWLQSFNVASHYKAAMIERAARLQREADELINAANKIKES